MASYYTNSVIDKENYSFQDKFLEYAHNWEDDDTKEKKRVKIIHYPNKDSELTFEDKINSYIEKNSNKITIIDIKYQRTSVLIIYEPK